MLLAPSFVVSALALLSPASAATLPPPSREEIVSTTTCNGNTYTYRALAGYGFVPGTARDKYGDTLGGLGSAIAIEPGSWKRGINSSSPTNGTAAAAAAVYTGVLWALPDRGWNTNGTLNYTPRVHKLAISFAPAEGGAPNLRLEYLDTLLLRDPAGTPVTGLDPDVAGSIGFEGFPELPVATYEGDGFGRDGPGGRRVAVDSEGLVLGADGDFWVSDEYGPYIYRFAREDGRMLAAIRPPDAYIPQRNGSQSFSAASPPLYDPSRATIPEDPSSGRANNQGFEGLTISPDGRTLSVLLQSALIQDGGSSSSKRRHARLLQYDISNAAQAAPRYKASYVVPLPTYLNHNNNTRVAAQSELLALGPAQFLVLARDSNAGRAAERTASRYRHVDVFDVGANATNLVGFGGNADVDAVNGSVAAGGVLRAGVAPARYCAWLDVNDARELARFGLHNGGVDDAGLLNEKWEGLAAVPVLAADGRTAVEGEWFVFALSDDDFITQDGWMDGGSFAYKDGTGASLDNQALVFRVGLEAGLRPRGW